MKCLCISGATQFHLRCLASALVQAGVVFSSSEENCNLSLDQWHQQVVDAYALPGTPLVSITSPGKMWEQLAVNIFLAHMHRPVWGWADERSLALLDFWRTFEPGVRFILLCVPPQTFVAEAILTCSDPFDAQGLLEAWRLKHEVMLRFHLRHPEESLLLHADDALQCAPQVIEHCRKRWNLPLNASDDAVALADPKGRYRPLIRLMAARVVQGRLEEQALWNEIEASLVWLREPGESSAFDAAIQEAVADFHAIQNRLEEFVEQDRQLAAMREEHAKLQAKLQQTSEENELILRQLHQVQEELEHYFLKFQETQQRLTKTWIWRPAVIFQRFGKDHLSGSDKAMPTRQLLALRGENFVRAAYRVILGREADPVGLAHYRKLAALGLVGRILVLTRIWTSKEAKAKRKARAFWRQTHAGVG